MISGAAIKQDGVVYSVPRPGRHRDVMALLIKQDKKISGIEGFVTDGGEFLDRLQAETHARACGQLSKQVIGSILTSEDLW